MLLLSYLNVLAILSVNFCVKPINPNECRENPLTRSINSFNFNLLKTLADKTKKDNGNLFFSTISIECALGMLYLGASGNTKNELDMVFKSDSNRSLNSTLFQLVNRKICRNLFSTTESKKNVKIGIANKVLIRNDISMNEDYQDDLNCYFNANVTRFNSTFKRGTIAKKINNWVYKTTEGMIPKMLDHFSPMNVLSVLNAVFFRGTWLYQFDPEFTFEQKFFITPEKSVQIQYMSYPELKSFRGDHLRKDLKSRIIEIPYLDRDDSEDKKVFIESTMKEINQKSSLRKKRSSAPTQNEHSLFVILPNEKWGLNDLLSNLRQSDIEDAIEKVLQKKPEIIDLIMPKFKIESDVSDLKTTLQSLGLEKIFSKKADFSRIGKGTIRLTQIIHKAAIDVDEYGTKAAAATQGGYMPMGFIDDTRFRIDHPFLFVIRDNCKKLNLFTGVIKTLPEVIIEDDDDDD